MHLRAEPSPLTPALSLLASRPPNFILKIHFNQTSDPVSQILQSGHTSKQPSPNPTPVSKHVCPFISNLSPGVHLASKPPISCLEFPASRFLTNSSPQPHTTHPSSTLSSKCVPEIRILMLKASHSPCLTFSAKVYSRQNLSSQLI